MEPLKNIKRNYKNVSIKLEKGLSSISLDDTILNTPNGSKVEIPYKNLTNEIKQEWLKQGGTINFKSMPNTKLVFSVIDYVMPELENVKKDLINWASNDLLCYRVGSPSELVMIQEKSWGRYLNWLSKEYKVNMICTDQLSHIMQPKESIDQFNNVLSQYDEFFLLGLLELVRVYKSFIIGLGVITGNFDYKCAFNDSQLDEVWQRKKWGDDADALEESKDLLNRVGVINNYVDLLCN